MATYEKYINQLFEAENKYEKTIKVAETESDKMKENAAQKAHEDIVVLRNQMAVEFESKKVDNTKEKAEVHGKSQEAIHADSELFKKNKDVVIDMLVDRVMNVGYELPKNVKRDYAELRGQTR